MDIIKIYFLYIQSEINKYMRNKKIYVINKIYLFIKIENK